MRKSRMKQGVVNNDEAGFTVVELVFVMVVLAILVSIATLSYSGLQTQATKDLAEFDMKVIGSAARTYYMKNGAFPANLAALDPYLDELPKDKFAQALDYSIDVSNPILFKIWSTGPDGSQGGGDDLILTFSP